MLYPRNSVPLLWGRVLLASGLALAATYILPTLLITAAAVTQGFAVRGAPDPLWIEAFAAGTVRWGVPVAVALSTGAAAFWVARRAGRGPVLHGSVVGSTVALLGLGLDLLAGTPTLPLLTSVGIALASGWAGGALAQHRPRHVAHA